MDLSNLIIPIFIFISVLYLFRLGLSAYGTVTGPEGKTWLTAIVVATMAALIAAYFFSFPDEKAELEKQYSRKPQDKTIYISDDEREVDDVVISNLEDVKFGNTNPSKLSCMTWEEFKQMSQTKEYHKKFKDAIILASKIKLKRYLEIKRDITVAKGKQGIPDVVNAMTAENVSAGILKEIDEILASIDYCIKNISENDIKLRLQDTIAIGETVVGRQNVKDFMAQQLFVFSRNPRVFLNNFQNMCVFGPSGIGKTKLAMVISEMYTTAGILTRNNFIKTTKADFTTGYVNESSKLTRRVLMRGLEGVIFIDEAYDITPERTILQGKDHGGEAIAEMINHLDKFKGLSIVIAGGYEDDMKDRFLGANEGMDRRFFHKITLTSYSGKELFDLCKMFLRQNTIYLSPKSGSYLWGCIDKIYKENPELFNRQASDMLSLAGLIAHIAYSNKTGEFEEEHRDIISSAIAKFTSTKNFTIYPKI